LNTLAVFLAIEVDLNFALSAKVGRDRPAPNVADACTPAQESHWIFSFVVVDRGSGRY